MIRVDEGLVELKGASYTLAAETFGLLMSMISQLKERSEELAIDFVDGTKRFMDDCLSGKVDIKAYNNEPRKAETNIWDEMGNVYLTDDEEE